MKVSKRPCLIKIHKKYKHKLTRIVHASLMKCFKLHNSIINLNCRKLTCDYIKTNSLAGRKIYQNYDSLIQAFMHAN